jgi:hypothetical protein
MKKFAIEKKLIKPMFTSKYTTELGWISLPEMGCVFNYWHLHAKYKTEKSRDTAFAALVSKCGLFEYRKKDL